MATAYIDHIQTLNMEEENGVIRSVTRLAKVLDVTSTDYKVLWDVLQVAGIPLYGTRLDGQGFEELVLVRRSAEVRDKDACDVTLGYQHTLDGDNQQLNAPSTGIIYGRIRASVQQTTVNFYRQDGIGPPQQITVAHRFPNDDPDVAGKVIVQGGEVSVFQPQKIFQFSGYLDTTTPWLVADSLIASVNNGLWMNAAAYEWMCTEVAWERMRTGRYKFSFEFQHNPDTWNPTAVFIDERTGRPPPGLLNEAQALAAGLPAPGFRYVRYHKAVNFNIAFGAYFEGWQQAAPI